MSLDISFTQMQSTTVFDRNITHNLAKMAIHAGIYDVLWRGDEHGIETAAQLIDPLERALADLVAHPEKYTSFNAYNGWGTYEDFVEFVRDVLTNARTFPHATISISR